jgi:hypothetical protein
MTSTFDIYVPLSQVGAARALALAAHVAALPAAAYRCPARHRDHSTANGRTAPGSAR